MRRLAPLLLIAWSAVAQAEPRPYREVRNEIEEARVALAARMAAGEDVRGEAAAALSRAIVDEILPRWRGVAWARGKASLARSPEDRGAGVNCASFLVAAMEGAGLRFAHRGQLVRAPALRILEAVAPEGGADGGDEGGAADGDDGDAARIARGDSGAAIQRWNGTIPALERELLRRGPGVYLLGLAQHIGFAIVPDGVTPRRAAATAGGGTASAAADAGHGAAGDSGDGAAAEAGERAPLVRLVHASRTTGQVVDEPMATSRALLSSRGAPIFAVRLVRPALVKRWLAGAALGPR